MPPLRKGGDAAGAAGGIEVVGSRFSTMMLKNGSRNHGGFLCIPVGTTLSPPKWRRVFHLSVDKKDPLDRSERCFRPGGSFAVQLFRSSA